MAAAQTDGWALLVDNLTRSVTEDHLREIASLYGRVRDARIKTIGRWSAGQATIAFEDKRSMFKTLVYLDGGQLDGQMLRVNILSQGADGGEAEATPAGGTASQARDAR